MSRIIFAATAVFLLMFSLRIISFYYKIELVFSVGSAETF